MESKIRKNSIVKITNREENLKVVGCYKLDNYISVSPINNGGVFEISKLDIVEVVKY